MHKLTATFTWNLSTPLLIQLSNEEDIVFETDEGEFKIVVTLKWDDSWADKKKDDLYFVRGIYTIIVAVTKERTKFPPPPGKTSVGGNDWSTQTNYFSAILQQYNSVAAIILNRIISHFKYALHQPLLQALTGREQFLQNPRWTTEDGQLAGKGAAVGIAPGIAGVNPYRFGTIYLTDNLIPDLAAALNQNKTSRLFEDLFSDAQAAAVQQNLRRAVIELAISCEVAVKQKFFASPSPSGIAFEYLEDKGRVSITVIDFLDNVAKQAFGKSFRVDHENDFKHIDFIFRCRNKVAHRGIAEYKTDDGKLHQLNDKTFNYWIESVQKLFLWLDSL